MAKKAGTSLVHQHDIFQQILQISKYKNYLAATTYRISHVLLTVTPFTTTSQTFFFSGTFKTGLCALKI